MILPFEDLVSAEKSGRLAVTPCTDFGAISIELRMGKLFRRKEVTAMIRADEFDMSRDEYIDKILEEVEIPPEGLVIGPEDFYNWQPEQCVSLERGLRGEITSRSSYARLGLRVEAQDDDLKAFQYTRTVTPLCSLATTGCKVLLRPKEPLAQLYVHDMQSTPMLQWHEALARMDDGKLELVRDGKKLKPDDLTVHGLPCLTMDDTIKVYRGNVLVPGALKDKDFETVKLLRTKPLYLPKGTFFLSASAEEFSCDPAYCGYVTERHSIMTFQMLSARELWSMPYWSHANAPYVGPRNVFTGKITFENIMKQPGEIFPGMKQAELTLVPLTTPSAYTKESRYKGQLGATESRI